MAPNDSQIHTARDRPDSSWSQQQRNDYANQRNPNHPSYRINFRNTDTPSPRPSNSDNRQGPNRGTGYNRGTGNTYKGGNTYNGGNRGNTGHGNRGNRGGGNHDGNRSNGGPIAQPPEQRDWVGLFMNVATLACDVYKAYKTYENNNNRGRGRGNWRPPR